MIEKAKILVEELMKSDNSGHGMEHINRVFDLSMKFAKTENCNKTIVGLIALLHDADDYKLFGDVNQANLTNTNLILEKIGADEATKIQVVEQVSKIGYSKSLKGIRATSIEGMIVSDADMCDAIGANGILRTCQYEFKHGKPFFDKNTWPMEDVNLNSYTRKCSDTTICHMFEKILRLKNLILTESGKREAEQRHEFVILFLRQLFKKENASDWENYLDRFLEKINTK